MTNKLSPTRYDSCELCEDLGETCRHCVSVERSSILEKLWHLVLVHFGIRECCEAPRIVTRINTPDYYLYECLTCGDTRSGSTFLRMY